MEPWAGECGGGVYQKAQTAAGTHDGLVLSNDDAFATAPRGAQNKHTKQAYYWFLHLLVFILKRTIKKRQFNKQKF